MTEQERFLLACAMMRKLWQKYDAGGESMRSVRSQVLEAALWLVPEGWILPEVGTSHEHFEELEARKLEDFPPLVPAPRTLEEAPFGLYCFLAVHVVSTLTPRGSVVETQLLKQLSRLLYRKEVKFLLRSGKITPERLVQEGWRRRQELD